MATTRPGIVAGIHESAFVPGLDLARDFYHQALAPLLPQALPPHTCSTRTRTGRRPPSACVRR
ncbi:hypothetical protein [Nocardiopsis salina]|uniref:hypothetical protein n=1 Tax=Nocardiopsis salina TaxID=245836 RepID=UPI00034A0963|nr:hypothetical protein [Nocardiopsis salina]